MTNNEIIVDPKSEAAVVELLANIFTSIAFMEPGTIHRNIKLASDGGMTKYERSICVDFTNYLLKHFSTIFLGLIINEEIRKTFKEAVCIEVALDNHDEDYVKNIRNAQKEDCLSTDKNKRTDVYVVNLSAYNENTYKKLNKMISESFTKIEIYDETLDSIIDELTDEDKIDIGFCVSNFMYLLRAFSKNQLFATYTKTIINTAEEILFNREED